MADALAALVDTGGRTARQGDSDSGRALLLDPPTLAPTANALSACEQIFGAAPWWPAHPPGGIASLLIPALVQPRAVLNHGRPDSRPNCFVDAGISILRDPEPAKDELWMRIDHGPHGFLSTAAHAHADALSIELREGGRGILVDPGTYCYHDEKPWRDYFRSTVAHNTMEVAGRDQAVEAGPFLWLTRPNAGLTAASGVDSGPLASVEAWHDGYATLRGRPIHRRRATLNRIDRSVEIVDWLDSSRTGCELVSVRLAFHFHPFVDVAHRAGHLELEWGPWGARRWARMLLPGSLTWTLHRGETDPILGWYSPGFGRRQPAHCAIGTGTLAFGGSLCTSLAFMGYRHDATGTNIERTEPGVMA